jgi:hypothetical protein
VADVRRYVMSKKLIVGAAAGCAVLAAVAATKKRPAGPKPTMWDKMREGMEGMPEDFPPRVMFDNVAATKENTGRILEILDNSGRVAGLEVADPDPG